MESITTESRRKQARHRAMVEIVGGELKIYAIADSDTEAAEIFDAIKLIRGNGV